MFALDDIESADSAGHVHARRFGNIRRDAQAGHAHGEIGGRQRKLDEAADFLQLFFLAPVKRIEIVNFSGNGAIEGGGVKMSNRADSALSREKVLPDFVGADSQTT